MNIFFLDYDFVKCAQYHNNYHVSKMTTESAQMLSSAYRFYFGNKDEKYKMIGDLDEIIYKPYGLNHPCNIWVRESYENYIWLYNLFISLGDEYSYRFDRTHLSISKLKDILKEAPMLKGGVFTDPPLVMDEECKINGDVISSYRKYYKEKKKDLTRYTKRNIPDWLGS